MVVGYANWTANRSVRSLGEEIERATMSAERAAATEAVAKVHGMTFQTARRNKKTLPETGGPFSYALRA